MEVGRKVYGEGCPLLPVFCYALHLLMPGFKHKHIRCLSWLDLICPGTLEGLSLHMRQKEGAILASWVVLSNTKLGYATVDMKQNGLWYTVISILTSCSRRFWTRNAPQRPRCTQSRSPQRSFHWERTAMTLSVRTSCRGWYLGLIPGDPMRLGAPCSRGPNHHRLHGFHFPLLWVTPFLLIACPYSRVNATHHSLSVLWHHGWPTSCGRTLLLPARPKWGWLKLTCDSSARGDSLPADWTMHLWDQGHTCQAFLSFLIF